MLKILSLFDGISALQVAVNNIGIKDYSYYASEIDKYAIKVTQSNYPNTIQLGDVKKIRFTESHNIDILCGGFPCQDLSISKKNRKGLDGERSGLFYECVRILKETKPKFFIFENVASMPKDAKNTINFLNYMASN